MDKNKTVNINFKYNNGERTIEMFFDDVTPMEVVHELNIITRTVLNRLVKITKEKENLGDEYSLKEGFDVIRTCFMLELLQDTNIDTDKKVKN